jgi:iron complex transport system substrate-binding protein
MIDRPLRALRVPNLRRAMKPPVFLTGRFRSMNSNKQVNRSRQAGGNYKMRNVVRFLFAALICLTLAEAGRAETIVDQRGRSVVLKQPAQRLVFIPMPGPATFITIDGSDSKIVAMNPSSATAMRDGLLGEMFPNYTKIPTGILNGDPANFVPNIESILALRPDVVFQWASAGETIIGVLDRAGLPVLGMRAHTQDDFAGGALMMGQVAGKESRAKELVSRQQAVKQKIESEMRDLPPADRPRVLYLGRASNMLRVSGKDSYFDFYVRMVGGQNVASESPTIATVSIEQILTWNPQVVLLGNFDPLMPADLYKDPRWQNVEAVRTHRVYRVPLGGYRWDPPSQESALGWLWLAELLHPDRSTADLRAAMRDWFGFLYQHTLTEAEIDRVLYVTENSRSAGYDRFLAR